MQRFFYLFIIFSLIAVSSGKNQEETRLSKTNFEAWTIEYTPYKLLVQQAVENYLALGLTEETSELPKVNADDKIIIIRSYTTPNNIYQLWYGGKNNKYTKLDTKEVQWIFGETLRSTLLDRTTYFNLDTEIPFGTEASKSEEYLSNLIHWGNQEVVLDLPNKFLIKLHDFGFSGYIEDQSLGIPAAINGNMRFGVKSKYFGGGFVIPNLLPWVNGINFPERYNQSNNITSGVGGYGTINFSIVDYYLNFTSYPSFALQKVDTAQVHFIDFASAIKIRLNIDEKIIPFYPGAMKGYLGFYGYRANYNFKIDSFSADVAAEKKLAYKLNSDNYLYVGNEGGRKYYSGLALGLNGITRLRENGTPLLEWEIAAYLGSSLYSKLVVNFTEIFAVSTVYFYNLAEDHPWFPQQGIYLGVRINYSND